MQFDLNLLPPTKKKALRAGLVLAYVQSLTIVLFLFVILVSATIFSVRLMMKSDVDGLTEQARAASSDEATEILTSIKQVNDFLDKTEGLRLNFVPWADVLEQITPLVPRHTRLDKITIDGGGKIVITGLAETREEALALKQSLEEQPYITDLVSPLTNLLQKYNVDFNFEMKYVPEETP